MHRRQVCHRIPIIIPVHDSGFAAANASATRPAELITRNGRKTIQKGFREPRPGLIDLIRETVPFPIKLSVNRSFSAMNPQ